MKICLLSVCDCGNEEKLCCKLCHVFHDIMLLQFWPLFGNALEICFP
jgi:hypothetical protein